jgi:hypothetical protein
MSRSRRRAVAVLAAGVSCLALGAAAPAAASSVTQAGKTGSITGTVTDVEGHPVAGATVRALSGTHSAARTVSAANGSFNLDGLASGPYQVCLKSGHTTEDRPAAGYVDTCIDTAADSGPYEVTAGQPATAAGTLSLVPGAGVTGAVVDCRSGQPIAASVTVYQGGPDHAGEGSEVAHSTTTASGRFRLRGIPSISGQTEITFYSSAPAQYEPLFSFYDRQFTAGTVNELPRECLQPIG